MKQRAVRTALAGGLVLLATAPMTGTSSAINCVRIETVCTTVGVACNAADFLRTVCQKVAPL